MKRILKSFIIALILPLALIAPAAATSSNQCEQEGFAGTNYDVVICGQVIGTKLHVQSAKWSLTEKQNFTWCGWVRWVASYGSTHNKNVGHSRNFCIGAKTPTQSGDTTIDFTFPEDGTLTEVPLGQVGTGYPNLIRHTFQIHS